MSERTYIARADGWVAGRRVTQGDEISLTPAAARYEPVDPAPQPAKTPRRVPRAAEPPAAPPTTPEAEA